LTMRTSVVAVSGHINSFENPSHWSNTQLPAFLNEKGDR
jgi:hypothetical protein